jgi:hypothetical protein
MTKSPYLEHELRLQDVMAAIQVMGTYKWDSRPAEHWREILGIQPLSEEKWERIFEKHPEFFGEEPSKQHGKKMFLRWRRAYELTYDPVNLKDLTVEEKSKIVSEKSPEEVNFSRRPLSPEQIGTLLTIAVELHDRAKSFEERKRWWIALAIPSIIGVLGVIVGALLT